MDTNTMMEFIEKRIKSLPNDMLFSLYIFLLHADRRSL